MSSRDLRRRAVLVWVALLVAVPAAAQRGQTSALSGCVRDATDRPLAGVSLTITSPHLIGGPQTTATDEAGRYRFAALPPGSYGLSAALQGFETVQRSGIDLFPGLGLTLDILLNISPLGTTVEPTDPARRSRPPPHRDQATGVFSVNYPQIVDVSRTVRSAQAALTH